ncbi:MAG: Acetyl-coenzyme A carboxylase carboxyl transferase subunit beta [Planctomycetes bacterium]|nr:Acetyl-coenzyme A carboxylase carboxyl transferase subunit beta [Planctomycetota bacterium]
MAWQNKKKKEIPEGLWQVCDCCKEYIDRRQIEDALECCPKCGEHFPIGSRRRMEITADPGTFEEIGADVQSRDVLGFHDGKGGYAEKLVRARKSTGLGDACVAGRAKLLGRPVVLASLDFEFMGGSMGHAVGEKVAMALDAAREAGVPCVVFSASGGARMHEGAVSLMQMSKTSASIQRFKSTTRAPFVSVLTNPTTGGVTASFAALGDVILAEPKALIGFAGPRVIKNTIRQNLPEGFQTSEFLKEKGFVDRIVARKDMRESLGRIFSLLMGD